MTVVRVCRRTGEVTDEGCGHDECPPEYASHAHSRTDHGVDLGVYAPRPHGGGLPLREDDGWELRAVQITCHWVRA